MKDHSICDWEEDAWDAIRTDCGLLMTVEWGDEEGAPCICGKPLHLIPYGVDIDAAHTRYPTERLQHVLKAEPARADATDRSPTLASPRVGAMGVGQAADAAPALA